MGLSMVFIGLFPVYFRSFGTYFPLDQLTVVTPHIHIMDEIIWNTANVRNYKQMSMFEYTFSYKTMHTLSMEIDKI